MDVKVSKAAYKLAHELEDDGYETHCAMIKILCQEIAKLDACFLRLGSRFTEAKQSIKVLKAEIEVLKSRELTDEEMKDLIQEYWGSVHIVDPDGYLHEIAFIKAILRKAQEK